MLLIYACCCYAHRSPSQVWAVLKKDKEFTLKCPCCRGETQIGAKMPVLGSLCKQKFPEQFKSRSKQVSEEFDQLFEIAWREANSGCSTGGCTVM